MTQIELIVHMYSEVLPDFAKLFTAQLSSLALWPPERTRVRVTVCATPTDRLTIQVAREFDHHYMNERLPCEVICRMHTKGELFRRGYGRNEAAKRSQADVVWFADADYLFGPGCLDSIASTLFVDKYRAFPAPLVFPREVLIHRSHEAGDAELHRIVPGQVFSPDLSLFQPHRVKFAIGGLQIVSGDTARKYGYCDGTKWARPVDEAGGFRNTTEDKHYRRTFDAMGGSAPIHLPNLFRFRHSASAFEGAEKRLAQTEGR